jgi:hypothetical protein
MFPRIAQLLQCTLLALLLLSGCTGSDQDGDWLVITANGYPVRSERFSFHVEAGKVIGGYDGCNLWGRDDANADMIVTDLRECPQDAETRVYARVVQSPKLPTFHYDGQTLSLERLNERVVAVRAKDVS